MRIDLNADVGEGTFESPSDDSALIPFVSSVSIAAGGHAGDAASIRATIRLAREHAVAVGVHPGLRDREGFGRRELRLDPFDVERLVLEQIVAVAGAASDEGVELQHVKPHGALYNMSARDGALAAAIVGAIAIFDRGLVLFGPPHSQLLAAGRAAGLRTVVEGFADRAYAPDGSLVPRSVAGAVLDDVALVVERALRMVVDHTVVAVDGSIVWMDADTLCLHSDARGAAALAAAVRSALEVAHISVRAPGRG